MRGLLSAAVLVCLLAVPAPGADKGKEGPKKVEVKGTLRTGVVAIGGETTGTVIDTKAGRYELELGKDKALRAKARRLDGTPVVVAGTLEVRKGIEVRQRKIITVTSLKGADEK